ncbi:MAG: glycosyltransferase family 2 protein [Bacteroidetes bacterium]|nr:glycosyltransferase family 2 protein [Bacteroidota bacterium]
MDKKISIIVPCYNQEKFLEETLLSISNQTFLDWECLLINDGSTDKTEDICKKWVSKDPRFSYYKQDNQGVTKTRDFGLDIASGEWIQFIDADDIIDPFKLEISLQYSSQANVIICNFGMLVGNHIEPPFCDLTSSEISFENLLSRWDIDFNLPIHCVLIKKELIGNTRFKTNFKANEDWIFWLEIFNKKEILTKFINQQLAFYRYNPEGASKQFNSVFQDNFDVNQYIFDQYDESVKQLLFKRINYQNLSLRKINHDQKNYIQQLRNTKVLKFYLALKKMIYSLKK